MPADVVRLRVARALRIFLRRPAEHGSVEIEHDGTSTLGHLVQSSGLPLTEVGSMSVDGRRVTAGLRELRGVTVDVQPPTRPQRLTGWPRFVLDVHLGSLARRLRLLGIDVAYSSEADDDELVEIACANGRVLLTKNRGILFRRAVQQHAAFVRGNRTDEQVSDVLERFAPPLAPFTRCVACNGVLRSVAKSDVLAQLKPGTARTYDVFSRCSTCGGVYWRGAHAGRLDAAVAAADR